MKEHEIIKGVADSKGELVSLDNERMASFEKYIETNLNNEQFLVLSHTALAILRRIAWNIADENLHSKNSLPIPVGSLKLEEIPGFEEAFIELHQHLLLSTKDNTLHFIPEKIISTFTWQSIIKSFDYTTVKVE